jgi:hypothetical protein
VIFEPGKNIYLSSANTDTLVPSLYQCIETRSIEVSAIFASPFQPLCHQQNVCHQGGFLEDQTNGSHYGPSLGSKADVQEVPAVVLEFSSGLLGMYGVSNYKIKHRSDKSKCPGEFNVSLWER